MSDSIPKSASGRMYTPISELQLRRKIKVLTQHVEFLLRAHHAERTGHVSGRQLTQQELDSFRAAVDDLNSRYTR